MQATTEAATIEVDMRGRGCPCPLETTHLRDKLVLSDEEWSRLDTEAQTVVDASVAYATAGTDPSPSDALNDVYADPR